MTINLNNYQEFLLNYLDGELDDTATAELMAFLKVHAELKEELELLRAARLEPEEGLVFGDKSVLYREERSARSISLHRRWWVGAAAAAVLAIIVFSLLRSPEPVRTRSVSVSPARNITDTLVKAPADKHKTAPGRVIPENLAVTGHKSGKSGTLNHPVPVLRRKQKPAPLPQNKTVTGNTLATASPANPGMQRAHETGEHANAADSSHNLAALAVAQPAAPQAEKPITTETKPGSASQPPAVLRPSTSGASSLAAKTRQTSVGPDVLAAEADKLASAKQDLDEKITGKISGAQDFVAKKFRSLRKKGIRIGKLEIVMN